MNFFRNPKSPHAISEGIQKALTEPFIPEFSDYVQKIRRNCVAISCLVLVLLYGGVKVSPDLSTSGFKLEGIDDGLVRTLLLILTVYWLFHFAWCALDYLGEWRIRLTAHTDDPYTWDASNETAKKGRDSTFLRWIYFKHQPAIQFRQNLDEIKQLLTASSLDENTKQRLASNIDNGVMAIQNIANQDKVILDAFDLRMKRFESWWGFFKSSSTIRWLILELLFPIIIGIIAVHKLLEPYINAMLSGWQCH